MDIYSFQVEYDNKYDLLNKALSIYANVKNIDKGSNYLRPKLVKVLTFYILDGYSMKTKQLILDSLGINLKNLNQINSELTKKGFLVKDIMNYRNKFLSNDLKTFRDYFLNEQMDKLFLVALNPKDSDK